MKLLIILVILGLASAHAAPADVEPQIYRNFEESDTTNVLVQFKRANVEKVSRAIDDLKLTTRNAILVSQHAILKDHADAVQANVISMLDKLDSPEKKQYYSQLWISGELVVRDVDKETVEMLRNHPDVSKLVAEVFYPLEYIVEGEDFNITAENGILNQWGVAAVRAQNVWNTGNRGENIVVANTDTGVLHTHESLFSNYRGTMDNSHDYNWFAPTQRTAVPNDSNGHGTHVAGTISGTVNGIGVAPGSQWIACRGCGLLACSNFDLLECGHWVACPTTTTNTNPDCTRAPHVCNNSWGGGRGNAFYDPILAAWNRGGIVPIFAAGNSGPNCNTVNSPADRPNAIAVGSTAENNQISSFSSRGITIDNRPSPEVAGPGTSVVSASHQGNNLYRTLSGTSMAAPHLAGICALLKRHRPNYTNAQIQTALERGSVAIQPSGQTCGGIPDSALPNNQVGAGLTDAFHTITRA